MSAATLRAARVQELPAIRALLEENALPTSDLAESKPEFLVAFEGSQVVGCGGLERFGRSGLIRSVAVRADRRRSGIGQDLVQALEDHARLSGITDLVLLTETARDFFASRGYRTIERAQVPADVRASREFRLLCPQSAISLTKRL